MYYDQASKKVRADVMKPQAEERKKKEVFDLIEQEEENFEKWWNSFYCTDCSDPPTFHPPGRGREEEPVGSLAHLEPKPFKDTRRVHTPGQQLSKVFAKLLLDAASPHLE